MENRSENGEPTVTRGWIIVSYKYSVGGLASRFFIELRDNKKIIGVKCRECSRVIVPPISVCGKCFNKLDECVEVSCFGTLLTYTVVHYPPPVEWLKPPFAYGLIKLDGADTGFTHILGEVDLNDIRIGMRVEAVFSEKRQADIKDIKYLSRCEGGSNRERVFPLNRCPYYHLILTSPNFPHPVIFKSQQDCGTIILALGHGGKTSFCLIFCSGVLTTINFSNNFFHTI